MFMDKIVSETTLVDKTITVLNQELIADEFPARCKSSSKSGFAE